MEFRVSLITPGGSSSAPAHPCEELIVIRLVISLQIKSALLRLG